MNFLRAFAALLIYFSAATAAQPADVPQPPQPPQASPVADRVVATAPAAQTSPAASAEPLSTSQIILRIFQNERTLRKVVTAYRPLMETYLQMLHKDPEYVTVPNKDYYFLGKLDFSQGMQHISYVPKDGMPSRIGKGFKELFAYQFLPSGLAQMMFMDGEEFNPSEYTLEPAGREFLGEVRTLVFDVKPRAGAPSGKFIGRLWAEDRNYNVVRFNGTYTNSRILRRYIHFDSWRVNTAPNVWLPAQIYMEESEFRRGFARPKVMFKGQSRLWNYNPQAGLQQDEFTDLRVTSADAVRDSSRLAEDPSPVEARRLWERQAENNVVQKLQRAGLAAPAGEVDKVLQTVVNNLIVTNNLPLDDVRCRVLLTSPLESFNAGNTIIVSRGLVDVLPDEATLAAILAHELAHITLGHDLDTRYAFSDRILFPNEEAYKKFDFRRDSQEEQEADKKAMEILAKSPYRDKLGSAALFLNQLTERSSSLSGLIRTHLGNRVAKNGSVLRLAQLERANARLEPRKLDQIAALPLGARVKLDPWSNRISMRKAPPVALASPREKMPFEVAPVMLHLTRVDAAEPVAAAPRPQAAAVR